MSLREKVLSVLLLVSIVVSVFIYKGKTTYVVTKASPVPEFRVLNVYTFEGVRCYQLTFGLDTLIAVQKNQTIY